jgi:hypothetical protein
VDKDTLNHFNDLSKIEYQSDITNKKSPFDKFIKKIYKHKTGYYAYTSEEKINQEKDFVFSIYGEILPPSIDYLLSIIKLTEKDTFVDLGSGIGKICLQVFMNSEVNKIYGIEVCEHRHSIALNALKRAKRESPILFKKDKEILFIKENFLNFDFSNATVLLMCSTCFNDDLMTILGNKINETATIRCAISLRQLCNIDRLTLFKKVNILTSWSDSSPCYIYTTHYT